MAVAAPIKSGKTNRPASALRGNKLAAVVSIVVWQVIALLTVEAVLYRAGLGEEDIYKLDRNIGFKHFPDKRVTWRSEGYSQSYFDHDGMREPGLTVAKPPGVYRIALLGDSMVEGLQVPLEETFGQLVEKQLNRGNAAKIQVLNFANSGYSTAQEYLELKDKVFKYQPDLVVLGYMSRDMFENWSPPDQTITNVRPYALHLPGQHLIIDNSPVLSWMKTPRAKFLMQIEWLRHYSRIWGLISATETQLSLNDPLYRGIVALCTKPGKTLRAWGSDLSNLIKHPPTWNELARFAAPSFKINFFESTNQKQSALVQSSITHAPQTVPQLRLVKAPQLTEPNRPAALTVQAANGAAARSVAEPAPAANGNSVYVNLMATTMHSLIAQMQELAQAHQAKMAVLLLPSRAQLSPTQGMEQNFYHISYNDEINIVSKICTEERIPLLNGEAVFEKLPPKERPGMFYLMHMNAKGHQYLSAPLGSFLGKQLQGKN